MTEILSAYILLDRSASMAGPRWTTAINSINQYVATLKEAGTPTLITIAAFDSYGYPSAFQPTTSVASTNGLGISAIGTPLAEPALNYETLRHAVDISVFDNLREGECFPRGGTPLYDAVAKTINIAEVAGFAKTVIIIMTDGEENTSKVYNRNSITDRISSCTSRGWEVLFLGSEFNADSTATGVGLGTNKVMNATLNNQNAFMRGLATASTSYFETGEAVDTTQMRNSQ